VDAPMLDPTHGASVGPRPVSVKPAPSEGYGESSPVAYLPGWFTGHARSRTANRRRGWLAQVRIASAAGVEPGRAGIPSADRLRVSEDRAAEVRCRIAHQ
jgi:hypothetical protein